MVFIHLSGQALYIYGSMFYIALRARLVCNFLVVPLIPRYLGGLDLLYVSSGGRVYIYASERRNMQSKPRSREKEQPTLVNIGHIYIGIYSSRSSGQPNLTQKLNTVRALGLCSSIKEKAMGSDRPPIITQTAVGLIQGLILECLYGIGSVRKCVIWILIRWHICHDMAATSQATVAGRWSLLNC